MTTPVLNVSDKTLAELPRSTPFNVLALGPDFYVSQPRIGSTVKLKASDGEIEGTLTVAPQIGPLYGFMNLTMHGQAQHYATEQGRNPVGLFDSLEAVYGTKVKAVDPRTLYSQVTVMLPSIMPSYPVAPTMPVAA